MCTQVLHTHTQMDGQTDKRTDGQTNKQTDGHTCTQVYYAAKHTQRQTGVTNMWIDMYTGITQPNTQTQTTDKHTDGQTQQHTQKLPSHFSPCLTKPISITPQ